MSCAAGEAEFPPRMPWFWTSLVLPKLQVDQLRLGTPQGALVLDVRNGREVIDTICGRLA
jgi:hypothetical protein